MPEFRIRPARAADMEDIAAIYAGFVLGSTATFEIDPPSAGEIAARFDAVLSVGLPCLAAEVDGRVAGYAYATPYRPRPAYRFTVEDSIYVAPVFQGRGIGRALLQALIESCALWGAREMIAVIGGGRKMPPRFASTKSWDSVPRVCSKTSAISSAAPSTPF